MTQASAPVPELGRLATLIGSWRGEGRGRWGAARFGYVEELDFAYGGKPHLAYVQRTRATDDGRPLHAERGFWRVAGAEVELVIAQAIGVAEISVGAWDGDGVLRTRSATLAVTPTAKRVSAVSRTYQVSDGVLLCTMEMSTDGGGLLPHLEAHLERVG